MRAKLRTNEGGGKVVRIHLTLDEVFNLKRLAERAAKIPAGSVVIPHPPRDRFGLGCDNQSQAEVIFELVNCARCAGLSSGPVCASCGDDLRMEAEAEALGRQS